MDNYNKPSSTFKDRKKDTDKKIDLTISTIFHKDGKDTNFQENKRTVEDTEKKVSILPKLQHPPPVLPQHKPEPIKPTPTPTKPPTVQAPKERQPLATPPRPTVRPSVTTTRNQAKNNGDIRISSDLLKGVVIALLIVLFALIITRLIGC